MNVKGRRQVIRRHQRRLLLFDRNRLVVWLQKQLVPGALAGRHWENNLIVVLICVRVFPATICAIFLLLSQPGLRWALNVLHLAHLLSIHLPFLLWGVHQAIWCLHVDVETPWVFGTQAVRSGRVSPTVPKRHLLVRSQNAHQIVRISGVNDGLIIPVDSLCRLVIGRLRLDTLPDAFHALSQTKQVSILAYTSFLSLKREEMNGQLTLCLRAGLWCWRYRDVLMA